MKKIITICLIGIFSIFLSFTTKIDKPNYELLWSELKANDVKFPEIVFAQAVLESGHFKSFIFRTNNNLFGMRYPKVRETLATGAKSGYAVFSDWQSSVKDYKLWQDRFIQKRGIDTKAEYLTELDKVYSESNGYSAKLKKIIKNFEYLL